MLLMQITYLPAKKKKNAIRLSTNLLHQDHLGEILKMQIPEPLVPEALIPYGWARASGLLELIYTGSLEPTIKF